MIDEDKDNKIEKSEMKKHIAGLRGEADCD